MSLYIDQKCVQVQFSFGAGDRMQISLIFLLDIATSVMNNLFQWPATQSEVSTTPPPSLTYLDYAYGEGMQEWGDISKHCNGKRQSPIPLSTMTSVPVASKPLLHLSGSNQNPTTVTVTNTGKLVQYNFEFPRPIIARAAALDGEFQFHHIHFHWGATSADGAEHEVNGYRFPLEMHMVFFNRIYGNLETAMPSPNGLAVIGVIFQLDNESNVTYPWLSAMENVRLAEATYKLPDPSIFNVGALMKRIDWQYFSYKGSLTNPPCYETVTWIVMLKRFSIREAQMGIFRALLQVNGQPLVDNHRSMRDLNGRSVFLYH